MLRRSPTDAERRLWQRLRSRQLERTKFRRQYAFGPYVLDFYSPQYRLAIEVDGSSHVTPEGQVLDAARTEYLRGRGVRVLRFTNVEVLTATDVVLETVLRATSDPSPRPSPRAGRGSPSDAPIADGLQRREV